ncbi:type 2 lanthipeptide synthetase LanM family protein [Streptomyces sp. DSM 44915]|uniref:Type 2 lanthipeptide synthetase LanM family protein n=1 Tax=Streptomyces chisholmiae TaxID=3075540 RepID=A0ABU2JRI5_9ACTN|nr:type 2 lanthipeptide synthetase LanM family protein [Streptomyces sp. DSM 44915]MDT0267358.1 type 2 lanthipeptide synthetase LanM family protein [Streptomyces sp. DSM 44915]
MIPPPVPDEPDAPPPTWWWARGLALVERLPAPAVPPATPAGEPAWAAPDQGGLAERAARLGLPPGALAALRAEPAECLAARRARPPWAEFVERALATPDGDWPTPATTDEAAGDARVFLPVVRPLSRLADRDLARRLRQLPDAPVALTEVLAGLERRLAGRLAERGARVLVRELAGAGRAGRLRGAEPADRFADFLARAAARPGLTALVTRYPVLARLWAQECLAAVATVDELLTRFAADRPRIVAELLAGVDPGPLVAVEPGLGDPHQGGRSTTLLRFADGRRVLAKPRAQDGQRLLGELTGWLEERLPGLGTRTPRLVTGDGYGWVEFVAHRPCRGTGELARFYRRQGALTALLHAVDATDLHLENLVADGDHPVPIDTETLLHPALPEATLAGPDPAAQALAASVHRTGALPLPLVDEHGVRDVSALGGRGGGLGEGYTWRDAGTDRMRLVRGPVPHAAAHNLPVPDGSAVPAGDFEAALLIGFRAAYDAIVAHRGTLLGPGGPLAGAGALPARLIVRPSRLYATLLFEASHPEVLADALDRDAVFAVLGADSAGDPLRTALIEAEVADLWAGDLPVFFHRPVAADVWCADGTRLPGLLAEPALTGTRRKLTAMDEVDRHGQEWIVSASLATTRPSAGAPFHRPAPAGPPAPAVVPDPEQFLAAACGIADEIVGRAVHGAGRANWLGLELVDDRCWTVLPMGAGLGQGYPGVALFLAQLGRLTGVGRYTDLAGRALAALPGLLPALAADPALGAAVGPGAFHGLGGLTYATSRLATLLGDDLGLLPTAVEALALASQGPAPGLAAGTAGALAAADAVHREHGLPAAGALADRLADALDAAAGPAAGPGFAAGRAGVGWALLRRPATAPAGAAALRAALAEVTGRPGADAGWCAGLAGVLLASAAGPGAPAETARALDLLTRTPPSADLSPCHGELGVLEALAALAAHGHPPAAAALTRRSGALLGSLHRHGHRCGTPQHLPTPGLLSGLSGIGYGLLRLALPDIVPSVLLLQPAPGRSAPRQIHQHGSRSLTETDLP